jgi:hypothetical protein
MGVVPGGAGQAVVDTFTQVKEQTWDRTLNRSQ